MAKTIKRSGNRQLAVVYVPISSDIEIVPMGEVVQTDWSIEEAMSFVMTGGTNAPDSIRFTAGDGGGGDDHKPDPSCLDLCRLLVDRRRG